VGFVAIRRAILLAACIWTSLWLGKHFLQMLISGHDARVENILSRSWRVNMLKLKLNAPLKAVHVWKKKIFGGVV
jgi:hypothetical protein